MSYAFNIKNRHDRALSNEELHRFAPSIFARTASPDRSERFRPIATIDVVEALRKEGFIPVDARQTNFRNPDNREFTRHMIRFRPLEDRRTDVPMKIGDTFFEICLRNANDGTSPYVLDGGLFRLACLNGMVVADQNIGSVKVKHIGGIEKVAAKVIEGTYSVIETAHLALEAPDKWSRLQLEESERLALAEAARIVRFGETDESGEVSVNVPITARQMLLPRRREDFGTDLWSTFNVIQENSVRGGLGYTTVNQETNRRRRMHTREVRGIDQDVKLNKALWTIGQEFAKLKAAA